MKLLPYLHLTSITVGGCLLPASACGGGGGSTGTTGSTGTSGGGGSPSDPCEALCTPPAGACASEDPAPCRTACAAAIKDLDSTCKECVLANSGWTVVTCTCSGSQCTMTVTGPGNDGSPITGNNICDPSKDNRCSSYCLQPKGCAPYFACQSACGDGG